MKKKILLSIFVSFLAVSLDFSYSHADAYQIGEAKSKNINVRSENNSNSAVVSKLNPGQTVKILDSKNGWYKIKLGTGKDGWISSSLMNIKGNTETAVINADKVNIRQSTNTDSPSLGFLSEGSEVKVLSKTSDWYKISINDIEGYVHSSFIKGKEVNTSVTRGESRFGALVSVAKDQLDKKYVWAAIGPDAFDCSGYTRYVFKKALGIDLPHSSKEQSSMGATVAKEDLELGDLVFFDTDKDGDVSHVGIYLGNGSFIHCSSGKGRVMISQLDEGFYSSTYMWGKRISN